MLAPWRHTTYSLNNIDACQYMYAVGSPDILKNITVCENIYYSFIPRAGFLSIPVNGSLQYNGYKVDYKIEIMMRFVCIGLGLG